MEEFDRIARLFGLIAVRAGEVIMKDRESSGRPKIKADGSPVTAADLEADELIRSCLERNLSNIPVVSEETSPNVLSFGADRFILVDPLDGTKEFIRGESDFTVNIALIERATPVAGAVYAPALHQLYMGGTTAFKLDTRGDNTALSFSNMHSIKVRTAPSQGPRAVVSRSHLDAATKAWIECHQINDFRASGSSLKFCIIAEGEADVYPRLAPTMEWDTAAGHAVLSAAGGSVVALNGSPMRYGKLDYRNGEFVAWGMSPGCSK
ncbi:3'(2'),5'-bisphosphate nucleotidase CysQ [Bradyrhizobium sp. WSM471]|uniref:3'(2'),5'-bisphosphate nucleotidase CysQ n=1 Tax=Bradyrhizobium sp. WSM471 TaxID=319017 RepID=UPI00024D2C27|nr:MULTISPECIES: 3'(2'),5'-bisphosphate nucleotidase CysQ [Bradyrhizobium]EHR04626.1 3'(2'),5'-bisphosphate nucleotidase [Bradyrhizobium sp. WSM471]UFW39774.1 3'(2'),5'-bisphosphate nucleotidase CysQ [Bradyrhizobium canariense]